MITTIQGSNGKCRQCARVDKRWKERDGKFKKELKKIIFQNKNSVTKKNAFRKLSSRLDTTKERTDEYEDMYNFKHWFILYNISSLLV